MKFVTTHNIGHTAGKSVPLEVQLYAEVKVCQFTHNMSLCPSAYTITKTFLPDFDVTLRDEMLSPRTNSV